ncbi:MAG: DUF423 domain-containing protein [Pricia sp.]
MNKTIFLTGTIFGILAVVLGAFGAHGLENLVERDALETWETGVTYQMYHALLLLILANLNSIPAVAKKGIFYCFLAGIILFSFSIYFLATDALTSFNFKTIGFVTPLGGLSLIAGWVLLGIQYFRHNN